MVADEDTVCLSLERQTLIDILGDAFQGICYKNIMRRAFSKSPILENLTKIQVEKVIDRMQIEFKSGRSTIFPANTLRSDNLIVLIEGHIIKVSSPSWSKL